MPLTVKDFTALAEPYVQQLKKEKPDLLVSDVLDDEQHQYVNLVQKGGGVLGIALVGYTYVLEQMGIRFLRQAGTSAGAINTALMVISGKDKTEAKSEEVISILAEMDFFKFVDGPPLIKWLVKKFVKSKDFSRRVAAIIKFAAILFAVLFFGSGIFYLLQHFVPYLNRVTNIFFIGLGIVTFCIIAQVLYLKNVIKKFRLKGLGMNPGDYFYDWVKQQFIARNIHNVTDLVKKASELPALHLRETVNHPIGVSSLAADVTFITADLVTQNKIEFPGMIDLFRLPADRDTIHPAGFVRASMSLPVFFESYYIEHIPNTDPQVQKNWEERLGEKQAPFICRFVDGGVLSNFPMSIFYNPAVRTPRLPSFGINLDDSKPEDNAQSPTGWSFFGFIGRMFNTIRFYYDKDFLLKNKMFEKGVGTVPLSQFNWLNFFLSDQEKLDMFEAGAKAARDFLMKFDWEAYKRAREQYQDELKK
jgi:NTE family protein